MIEMARFCQSARLLSMQPRRLRSRCSPPPAACCRRRTRRGLLRTPRQVRLPCAHRAGRAPWPAPGGSRSSRSSIRRPPLHARGKRPAGLSKQRAPRPRAAPRGAPPPRRGCLRRARRGRGRAPGPPGVRGAHGRAAPWPHGRGTRARSPDRAAGASRPARPWRKSEPQPVARSSHGPGLRPNPGSPPRVPDRRPRPGRTASRATCWSPS
mmetsp:Transcript_26865/g.73893  ORF Transcript_26865/g.73893 Transcript_26865/m.73893 type:complete len:210 (+) Transcript_26865:102-731(+)